MLSQLLAASVYDAEVATGMSVIFGMLAIIMIPFLILGIIYLIGMWKLFEKAGRPGWNAIIPFYSQYVLTEISGQEGLLFLLIFIPGVGAVIWQIMVALKIAPAFGKSTGFAIGLILLAPIFYCILGFGSDTYLLDNAANTQSPFDTQPNQDAQTTDNPASTPETPADSATPAAEAPTATESENPFQTPPAQA